MSNERASSGQRRLVSCSDQFVTIRSKLLMLYSSHLAGRSVLELILHQMMMTSMWIAFLEGWLLIHYSTTMLRRQVRLGFDCALLLPPLVELSFAEL